MKIYFPLLESGPAFLSRGRWSLACLFFVKVLLVSEAAYESPKFFFPLFLWKLTHNPCKKRWSFQLKNGCCKVRFDFFIPCWGCDLFFPPPIIIWRSVFGSIYGIFRGVFLCFFGGAKKHMAGSVFGWREKRYEKLLMVKTFRSLVFQQFGVMMKKWKTWLSGGI